MFSGNAHRVKEVTTEDNCPRSGSNIVGKKARSSLDPEVLEPPFEGLVADDDLERASAQKEQPLEDETHEPTVAEIANAQNPLGVLMFGGVKEPQDESMSELNPNKKVSKANA